MKFKILLFLLMISVIVCSGCVGVCAVSLSEHEVYEIMPTVSYGLEVIAGQTDMRVCTLYGQSLDFSRECFMRGMNLSDIEFIQVTSLPSAVYGTLFYGSEKMTEGQVISGDFIDKMTFSPSGKFTDCATFKFRVNGSNYENECKMYFLESVNASPSTDNASYVSLNLETYRNIDAFGVLSGYDSDGDEVTFEITKYPEEGVVKILDKKYGTYSYTPLSGYSGKDEFEYVVRDEYGNYSASATVEVTISVPSVSVVYSDLDGSDVYSHAINLTENGIMNGVQVGDYFYFKPEETVTRAEFIVTAMTALGIKNVPDVSDTGFFDDSDIRPELKGYIALAYSKGYISGKRVDGEICFDPNEVIKLSEASVIISNIIGYSDPEIKPVFSDSSIPSWSARAVISLHALGVLECSDGTIDAGGDVSRGEMAKLLSRSMIISGR